MAIDTKNFKVKEFECRCGCGKCDIDQRVMNIAQKLRDQLGVPVKVNSGCRCEKHNASVGGVKGSYHTQGLAADLSCTKGAPDMFAAVQALYWAGDIPELSYCIRYKTFIHIDCGKKRNRVFEVRA